MTIVGTRPEIIRLSQLIPLLDEHAEHHLVHTGQNYDPGLSDIFFSELGVRRPNVHLGVRSLRFSEQVGAILDRVDSALSEALPDRVLILGDTNSGLAAIVAARRGIPVFHLEAGNRCYDDRVPEEINRRIIDHCSTVLMPYTRRSCENLVREGFERDRIFVVGNPINEVLRCYAPQIAESTIHKRLSIEDGNYLLVTMHRAENVDDPDRLDRLVLGLEAVAKDAKMKLVWPVHPRTAARLRRRPSTLILTEPFGFIDFVRLERGAACVLTDSGTVQEECAILHIPNVTIRDVTERPETIEAGSNVVAGSDPSDLVRLVRLARTLPTTWSAPPEYLVENASTAIAKVVLGRSSVRRQPA